MRGRIQKNKIIGIYFVNEKPKLSEANKAIKRRLIDIKSCLPCVLRHKLFHQIKLNSSCNGTIVLGFKKKRMFFGLALT